MPNAFRTSGVMEKAGLLKRSGGALKMAMRLIERIVADLDQLSRRGSLSIWLPTFARVVAFGFLALLLARALIWSINNLIPGAISGTATEFFKEATPVPSSVAGVDSTPAYCPVTPIQLDKPDNKTLLAILSLLHQETKAQRDHDSEAYQTLLDPRADPEWKEIGLDRIRTVVSPLPEAILVQRAVVHDNLAMALVFIESGEPMYAVRNFRNTGPEGWKLTSPLAETWGERRTMQQENLKLHYYAFDEPYVSAVSARLAPYLERVAQDFGATLKDQPSLEVSLVPAEGPKSFWDEETDDRILFMHSFLLQQADTLEEYLAWGLYDRLARLLISRVLGDTMMEERWSNLAEAWVRSQESP